MKRANSSVFKEEISRLPDPEQFVLFPEVFEKLCVLQDITEGKEERAIGLSLA